MANTDRLRTFPGPAAANGGPFIAPSLLAANASALGQEACALAEAGANWLHVDVMDGHFVPNIAFGPHVVQALRRAVTLPLDVHLMVAQPMRWIGPFADAGAQVLTCHVEALSDVAAFIAEVRARGLAVGLSFRPQTPLARVLPWLPALDLLLVMGVVPGFGGQSFLPATLETLRTLRAAGKGQAATGPLLQVDGGINAQTAPRVRAAGADALVAGSAIFAPAAEDEAHAADTVPVRYRKRMAALRALP